MKITKYEHACLLLEVLDQVLIIDPGIFAKSLPSDLKNVVAVVITHEHGDHLDKDLLRKIIESNPGLTIFAPQDVLVQLSDFAVKQELAQPGISHTSGSFVLDFYGKDHAVVYETVPCMNVGVMVNKALYYPGDSFTIPKEPVVLLALPSVAPWLKIGESIAFMKLVKPAKAFPTHNALYNESGDMYANNWLSQQAEIFGVDFKVIGTGQSVEV